MPQLIILRGVPGSGKTTWAREHYPTFKRVSKDDLRAMLDDGEYSLVNEKFVQEAQIALIRLAAHHMRAVIVDDTNANPDHVRTFRELAAELGYAFRIVDMDTPLEECIRRDAQRVRPVGAVCIQKMWDRLEAGKTAPSDAEMLSLMRKALDRI
jgi:predicted kinase